MDIYACYCTHFGCWLCFTLSSFVYLATCCTVVAPTFIGLTFLQMVLINFVPHEISCKICASWSPEEWDETFECFIDVTLAIMELELGHRYLNRIDHMPMHKSVRTGHQYMLELLNEHPDKLFNKICMYRPCFEMLIQVLRQ